MTMIPTAQVLAAILNDPTIPAEAKPEQFSYARTWETVGDKQIWHPPCDGYYGCEYVNAALYWSLSAWLRERGIEVRISMHQTLFQFTNTGNGYPPSFPVATTPVEALAAVVREVASRGTLPP